MRLDRPNGYGVTLVHCFMQYQVVECGRLLNDLICFVLGGPLTYIFKSDHTSIVKHHFNTDLKKSLTKFLEKVFYKELQINPKNQCIIICESLMNPTKLREELAQVLFNHFEVKVSRSCIFILLSWVVSILPSMTK